MDANLAALLSLTGLEVFFDSDYGATLRNDLSNNYVSDLEDRTGNYTVSQSTATSTAQPLYSGTTPTGRRGMFFSGTQYLISADSVLAAAIDGSQAISFLAVTDSDAATTQTVWGAGSTTTGQLFRHVETAPSPGVTYNNNFQRIDGVGNTTNTDTTSTGVGLHLISGVYTGSAYTGMVDETVKRTSDANTRAPACDRFLLGGRMVSGVVSQQYGGHIYAVLIATAAWDSSEWATARAAAKAYYGTP